MPTRTRRGPSVRHQLLARAVPRFDRRFGVVTETVPGPAGDSAGDRGGPQPSHLLLHSPWVDLTTSAPETEAVSATDPWLFLGKLRAYAGWWAGPPEDLGRPEVSPALAAEARWDLTYVERPGMIHVYPLLPAIPEGREAWRQSLEFLR